MIGLISLKVNESEKFKFCSRGFLVIYILYFSKSNVLLCIPPYFVYIFRVL
jgi:hypothetical protein